MSDALEPLIIELAKLQHERYLEAIQGTDEYDPDQREAHRPWEDLRPEWRHANIDQVLHSVRKKLRSAGLTAFRGLDVEGAVDELDADEVELMAVAEHRRWCNHKRMTGWVFGSPRDDERKMHDLLVPWAELSEYQREKDREPCRSLPSDLRTVGWSLVRDGD